MQNKIKKRDLIIIGGGAGGLVVASVAAQLGLKVTLIEKQKSLGGDCLHYGCVPSKTFIKSAKVAYLMQTANQYGLKLSKPEIDFKQITQHVQEVIAKIQQHDDPDRFRSYGCEVLFGEAKFISSRKIEFDGKILSAKRFVIATGSSPNIPPIPGIDEVDYLTNEKLFSLTTQPKHLLVLGAGIIGLEMAQAFNRLGTEVTLVDQSEHILPSADREVSDRLQALLTKEGLEFKFVDKVERIKKQDDDIVLFCRTKTGGEITIRGTDLLVATGRKPNITGLNLEAAHVKISEQGIEVNKKLQTSQSHIYALGDCIASPYKFTHVSEYQAGIVISNAVFRFPKKVDYSVVPSVVFTDPEFAMVGVTEQDAGSGAEILRFEFKELDRALAEAEPYGMAKLIVKKGKVIGASILGLHAGELIAEIALAMQAGLNIKHISNTIHAYPTLAQVNRCVINSYYAPKLFSKITKKMVKMINWIF